MIDVPASARVVIVGGGIVGCSVAYHLGKLGWSDVLLLEQGQLTSGSTWHAAGLVGQLRTSANITQLLGYSVELYGKLEAETGQATGWKRNGGLRLACTADRWTEVRRQATTAHSFGLEMHLLSASEAQALWPPMAVEDVVGAAFLPTDGQANPADITQALAKGARLAGVTLREGVTVTGFELELGRVRAVHTSAGRIACEKVVLCAGQWTRALAALAGVNVPLVSVRHQYLVTEPIAGVTPGLPTLRDPDRLTYYKEEVGGLVMGGYEPNPKPWAEQGLPERFEFQLLDEDWDHFEPIMELALGRVPALRDAGVKQLINGPESFTPDGNWIIGEAPETRGIFVGAGFNAFGIASAGGAGMALAEWVAKGEPPFDVWPVDIRRFGRNHMDTDWVRTRTLEAYARHYAMAWPHEEYHVGPPSAPLAALAAPARPGRLLRREAGLGAAQLVRGPGRGAGRRSGLRPPQLVRCRRPRASGLSRARGAVRPVLVREVPPGRPRRRDRTVLAVRQRRGEAAGQPDLHPAAERAGRHRVRPDGGAPDSRPVLSRHRHRLRHARFRLDRPPHPGWPGRAPDRRHQRARRPFPVRTQEHARSWAG